MNMEDSGVTSSLRFPSSTLHRAMGGMHLQGLPCSDAGVEMTGLQATIENEIIPRLVLSHLNPSCDRPEGVVGEDCLRAAASELADCAEDNEMRAARAVVDRLLQRGMSVEGVFMRVLAEAARILGTRWEMDRTDFVQVTLGVGLLQALMRELADDYAHEMEGLASERRILLVPTPGESHGFGAAMAAEIFRRRGWNVDAEGPPDLDNLVQRVRGDWFHVVALSLSCEAHLGHLADAVRQVRAESRNRRVGVMIGGPLFNLHPDWISRAGADACSHDALHAVGQAEHLVGLLVSGR